MKLTTSLDWDQVRSELVINATHSGIQFKEMSHIMRNLNEEVKKLGNEEIHARITGKDRRVKEKLEQINSVIETIEQHILLASLSL